MLELPTTFGKYFLTERLAVGGMAEIFLAKLIGPGGFEKQLVIKQIHPALSSQRAFVDLFVAEAKTLVSLSHGNIVPVYELGVVDDTYFIAMEFIDGPTLWQLTEAVFAADAPLAPPIAAHVAAEIAKGLDYAHRKGAGVIHRDLSPRNVMITRDGEVKLVDFGIAVALGSGPDPADGGLPTGSFPYMSPEQARGDSLSAQTDLFSLGVLLWEMLTGRRLFVRADPEATLAAVQTADIPRASSVRPDVPERLDAVVAQALARDPAARFDSAGALAAELQRYLADATALQGPRELADVVARAVPPTAPAPSDGGPSTHLDPAPDDPHGPSTQVVPRSQARGKRRPTVREATFATHVEIERALAPSTTPVAPVSGARAVPTPSAAPDPTPEPTSAPIAPPPRRGPVALLAALAVTATVGAGWLAIDRARGRGGPAVAPPIDAAPIAIDARAIDAAGPVDAAPVDAAPIAIDARAASAPPPDVRAAPPDARPPAAKGQLRVGADPWGEVFLDGRRLGRAPNQWDVPAGAHVVEVVFPGEAGEVRRRFEIDVPAGERASVFADFKAP